MKEYWYCLDGQTVDGPHSEGEMHDLVHAGILPPETKVCAAGEKDWLPIGGIQFSPSNSQDVSNQETPPSTEAETSLDRDAIIAAGNDKDEEEEASEEDAKKKEIGKYQLIVGIRKDLDLLWKFQRESLISQIRGRELDASCETTRKQAKLIKDRVKDAMVAYWHKSKSYDSWIKALVWKDTDIQRKLRGTGCDEKYEDAVAWLTKAKLIDEAGCYCFKRGKEYLYIGRAGIGEYTLGRRLHDHRKTVFFEQATHLRIIIPAHKSWITKLERLLLLNYWPTQHNENAGTSGKNAADDLLTIMGKEMEDLLHDGSYSS